MIISKSNELKKKIEIFNSNFLSKEDFIKFEENQFDKFIGMIFDSTIKTFLFIYNMLFEPIKKILNKFLDFISKQNEFKNKLLQQEEILTKNIKLNLELSTQINKINEKIDNITFKDNSYFKDKKIEEKINQPIFNENNRLSNIQDDNDIKFYQKENLRISNELYETKTKFEIVKKEMEKFQEQRTHLIDKINSINEAVEDTNIVTSVFKNDHNINKVKIVNPNKSKLNTDLNEEVNKIFVKI